MKKSLSDISGHYPTSSKIWLIGGLVIKSQIAGLKQLADVDDKDKKDSSWISDVSGSASSLSLGSNNPYLAKMDQIELLIGTNDNICPALRHRSEF